ncbi:Tannase/feruloyl esterase [Xylariaceae sp. FL0255]|nr:Tannase/feruloyl esterase [Xylariaceae sp. FL0255]
MSLASLCTVANVQAALPANGTILGIELNPSSVTASPLYNVTSAAGGPSGGSTTSTPLTYCNVTLSYSHTGTSDKVVVHYALPEPSAFKNRYYNAGGGGYSLNSDATGGITYGAASGATDAGYDAFTTSYDEVVLYGNGTINWDATHMFGYQALGELTEIGKPLARGFYGLADDAKLYTYFEGCSDGGREAMSQVQRWPELYDGVIAGAPAFRLSHQQVLHVYSSLIEYTQDYYPPPCALSKIVNATITACDPLDGKKDGVVSRTDLCKLNFNLNSTIGEAYYCAAAPASFMAGATPAQKGTVTAQDVAVAQSIYDGIFNSKGQRAYLSWQYAATLPDATTAYNNATASWELAGITSIGGEWVAKWIELIDIPDITSLVNVTSDTLTEWMEIGLIRYQDVLQTTLPDLTAFQTGGSKLLHFHGESDNSIPTASSVHYWQSVRSIMYPDLSDTDAESALADWYQLYLIPGAAHCSANPLQPGPYPEDNMATMIDWVENGVTPTHLNGTISAGADKGDVQQLCQWPNRPLWQGNSSTFDCVYDQASIDSWTYTFNAFKIPVY